jgi:type I restriction enzyme S subunit
MKNGWPTKSLSDVAEVIAGQSPEGSYYNTSGDGLPFYQGKKDFGERFIGTPTTWTSQITKVALEGDVLMSVRAPVSELCD